MRRVILIWNRLLKQKFLILSAKIIIPSCQEGLWKLLQKLQKEYNKLLSKTDKDLHSQSKRIDCLNLKAMDVKEISSNVLSQPKNKWQRREVSLFNNHLLLLHGTVIPT